MLRRVFVCMAAQVTTKSIEVVHSVHIYLHEQGFTLTFVLFWPSLLLEPLCPSDEHLLQYKMSDQTFYGWKDFFFQCTCDVFIHNSKPCRNTLSNGLR